MLNPDGVIVGNYRTNLAAKDLNRTYMNPKKVGTKMRCLKRRMGCTTGYDGTSTVIFCF